jgi:head-tail adaptor
MSGLGEFAGTMRERVVLQRRSAGQDALGAAEDDWTIIDVVWASVRVAGHGASDVGDAASALPLWRVTLRPCDVRVGDRIERITNVIEVREVIDDPALADRVVAIGGARR